MMSMIADMAPGLAHHVAVSGSEPHRMSPTVLYPLSPAASFPLVGVICNTVY
jgi:hypothetical protein